MDHIIADLPSIISIFGLAWFYFWPSIPAGLALGLSPVVIVLTTSLSFASGAAVVTLVGGPLRARIMRRIGSRAVVKPGSRLYRIWERFGMIGLGLAAPMTLGAQIGAAVGLALNAPPRRLFVWMALGGLLWSVTLTLLVSLGIVGAQQVIRP
ncbi:MAG: small multi-drug export protein [Chloroflexi bacterium]|nr:small multi-drug export protein [Chloroflexota bacterium]